MPDVFIQATETDPAVRAAAVVRHIHDRLRNRLASLADHEPGIVAGFCAGELRRHLAAADEALYAPAAGAPETRLLIRAMRTTAAEIERRIGVLDPSGDPAAFARNIGSVLAVHLTVEETVLLPALAELPGADLGLLVADLQTLLDGGRLERPDVIDVREIPRGQKHPRIFARFSRLAPGESFALVNNHDPKHLRREFEAAHPGAFSWEYEETGPEVWRLRIGRPA
ncbi:DUF2249 domain-containing protein [Actinomadura bangladeshensis]|uniref:DUF2249 domain-containing protein n=1 Tax=Actinomadura bangladeshensis TaxID=453573 RepID=A0A4R4PE33_9ACTN|nr:DUF2249 domain-containing protein [Actinomadura bangladeshensis]TDC19072.1 DUF2249 domain-containing protein [Actinomadura bangladeshensis]